MQGEDWAEQDGMTMLFEPSDRTKTCPRCGQQVFADMNVCYGCLYDFAQGAEEFMTLDLSAGKAAKVARPCLSLRVASEYVDVDVPLPKEGLVVGRSSECDVVLHARSVSRKHVRIDPSDTGACATDLAARNPATIDGKPVGEGTQMAAGDELMVCGIKLTLVAT